MSNDTWRRDTDHFVQGYTAQLASFVDAIRTGTVTGPTGEDARNALAIALACIQSVTDDSSLQPLGRIARDGVCQELSQHIRNLSNPPANFEELKRAIACRDVTFPLRVENVAKRVLAKPELIAFGSATSIANDCGVSASTVMRFVAHIGFHEIAQARTIFRNELCRRQSVLLIGSGTKNRSED